MRGALARLGLVLFGLALGLAGLEVTFRVLGGTISAQRAVAPVLGDHFVILAVGDSHTWGRGKGFPARMAERLAKRSARYRVINIGVPGTNTAQHRRRFAKYLDDYQPRVVVSWMGLNNAHRLTDSEWNEVGVETPSLWEWLADEVRVLRFVRLLRHQARLNVLLEDYDGLVVPEAGLRESEHEKWAYREERSWKIPGMKSEVFRVERSGSRLTSDEIAAATELDLTAMVQMARARGVPMVLIGYGLPGGPFLAATRGVRRTTEKTGAILVGAWEAEARIVERRAALGEKVAKEELYTPSVHPTQLVYSEVGDLVLERLDERGLLPFGEVGDSSPTSDDR